MSRHQLASNIRMTLAAAVCAALAAPLGSTPALALHAVAADKRSSTVMSRNAAIAGGQGMRDTVMHPGQS